MHEPARLRRRPQLERSSIEFGAPIERERGNRLVRETQCAVGGPLSISCIDPEVDQGTNGRKGRLFDRFCNDARPHGPIGETDFLDGSSLDGRARNGDLVTRGRRANLDQASFHEFPDRRGIAGQLLRQ